MKMIGWKSLRRKASTIHFRTLIAFAVAASIILVTVGYWVIVSSQKIVLESRANNLRVIGQFISSIETNQLFMFSDVQSPQKHVEEWLDRYKLDYVVYVDARTGEVYQASKYPELSLEGETRTTETIDLVYDKVDLGKVLIGYLNYDLSIQKFYFIIFGILIFVLFFLLVWATNRFIGNLLSPVITVFEKIRTFKPGSEIVVDKYRQMAQPEVQEIIASFIELQENVNSAKLAESEAHRNEKLKDELLQKQVRFVEMGNTIGNIAHQWKQPLSVIASTIGQVRLDVIFKELEEEQLLHGMDAVEKQVDYMSSTIDTFLNFLSDKKEHEVKEFYVEAVLRNAKMLLEATAQASGIMISVPSHNRIKITGPQAEFEQAMVALINNAINAIKAHESELRVITASARARSGGRFIELTIKDTGGGVAEEYIDKIFDAYFTTLHESRGTGLGLFIVKSLVEISFHGKISVHNEAAGAVFTILIDREGDRIAHNGFGENDTSA